MARSRTLTVLVADVVRSTELFGRLGADRADAARRTLFAAFSTAIEAADGALIKTMGDGCLASFGSAADAVSAAIAVQQATAALRERKVPGLGLRVGVAVGDVTEEDGDVFGPAVVMASRLCGAAGEHQVFATDLVRLLARDRGGHHYETVGELVLKGIAEPVPTCVIRVDAGTSGPALPAGLAEAPAELVVGRDPELAVLRTAWESASAGERRVVLVAGEPGVGKTRLAAALARRAHSEGALVLFGRCTEDLAAAYQPFAEALRAGIAWIDPDAVAAHLSAHGGEIRRLVPSVEAAEPLQAEPALEQARLFDAVTDLLHRATEDRPVVLVLDDLHWAAPSTIALLRHLIAADARRSLLVLGTYRDTEVDQPHAIGGLLADIHQTEGLERVSVRGLDGPSVEELLAATSEGDLDDEVRALASDLAVRTNGNPFFTNQVLGHLVERGLLVQEQGRWAMRGPLDAADLPEGVRDVVGRRLARLSPGANQALAVAAVAGLHFRLRVLCEVPDAGAPDAVVDALDEATRAGLLVETAPGRFAFTHAIVRDALTSTLTVTKRARLHRALGLVLLAVYGNGPEAPLADLAHHFTEAAVLGDTASAARWSTAAAAAAADQADHDGAIAVLQRALAVVEDVEPVDQGARFDVAVALAERHLALLKVDVSSVGAGVDAARRLGSGQRLLRIAMARYTRGGGVADDPAGIELYEEALELLEPEAVPLRALATASIAQLRSLQGIPSFVDDVEVAVALLPDVEVAAPKVGAAIRRFVVHASLGLPGAAQRLRLCDEALAVSPAAEDPWWAELATGVNISGSLKLHRGHALMALGRRAEFETNLAEITELGEATGNSLLVVLAHARLALLTMLDGRFRDVSPIAERMLDAMPGGQANLRVPYHGLLGAVALEEGRIADLLPIAEAALAVTPQLPAARARLGRVLLEHGDRPGAARVLDGLVRGWTGWARDWTWPFALAETAEIVAGLQATEHAAPVATELEMYSGELALAGSFCPGAFDRYRGMLLGLLGDHDEAVAALEAALVLEESIGAPPLAARTRHWMARARLRRDGPGDRRRAVEELDRSIAAAGELGMAGLGAASRELAVNRG